MIHVKLCFDLWILVLAGQAAAVVLLTFSVFGMLDRAWSNLAWWKVSLWQGVGTG